MKINKYFTLLIILFSLLILTNSIYATEENNTENTANEETEYTTVSNMNQFKDVFERVGKSSNKTHEINLKKNIYKLTSFKGKIESNISKEITLNGNDSIIDGNNQRSFLIIPNNVKLTINNLTIINMYKDYGSAITNSGKLILNNVTFENNSVQNIDPVLGGAAVYSDGFSNITNCKFNNNQAYTRGSAVFIKQADSINIENNIINCTFSNNTAQKGPTIYLLGRSSVNIINSTFSNENNNGSIISNENSDLRIENSIFHDENSSSIITNNKNCTIDNSHFYNNNINDLFINENNLTLINSNISNNNINTVITNRKKLTIKNTEINSNIIKSSLILNQNNTENETKYLNMDNSTLYNNTANNTCGIKNTYNNSIIYVNNSTWTNNTSLLDEGVLNDFYGSMNVLNSKFYNNTSLDLFNGNVENYLLVQNNTYKGNLLKSYLNTSSRANENVLNINATLKTDDIYNTTVNSGHIVLSQQGNVLYEDDIQNHHFSITAIINPEDLNDLRLNYEGSMDFRDLSKNIEISLLSEEYEVNISNVTDTYVIGDNISFDLIIRNSGNTTVNNIILRNILPYELNYISSTEEFDFENNCFILNSLNINQSKIIRFTSNVSVYRDLILNFNIFDENRNVFYEYHKSIDFVKPSISIEPLTAHPGEVVNISARINNYNKNSVDSFKFKFKYKVVDNIHTRFENNTLYVENYKLEESLVKKDYPIELICEDNNLEEKFSNTSKISVNKYETYSIMNYNISGNLLNLKVNILDEKNNNVTGASVFIKINGKSIKSFKLTDGLVELTNYKLPSNYLEEYNISVTFTGNNKYQTHNNNTIIQKIKKEIDMNVSYSTENNMIIISIKIMTIDGYLPESGCVAVKINDKTIQPKIDINESIIVSYDINEIYNFQNITASYYGNEDYLVKSETIAIS